VKLSRAKKTREIVEFGDFQTPIELALEATNLVKKLGISPKSILEPSCGRGAFVDAAARAFSDANRIVGVDINPAHLDAAKRLQARDSRIEIGTANFFDVEWRTLLRKYDEPHLILGNPPWVTSAELGSLSSNNLPEKSNFQGRSGIEAITGKSNFDISEWMLLRYLDCLEGRPGALAVLCKTTVARKVLLSAWSRNFPVDFAQIYKIDALAHFGAAVDACFFVLQTAKVPREERLCDVFESLDASNSSSTISYRDGHLVANDAAYLKCRSLIGLEQRYIWRSGIKHDCSKVMELRTTEDGYVNGFGEGVFVEEEFLYPMLKSSDVGNGRIHPRSRMIVTQKFVGEDTSSIERLAPHTWAYLARHAEHLERRGSSIYRNKPKFSIFGVGPYSFAPWKIAISGLYKSLRFVRVGPHSGKPVVLDDTITFLPCKSESEANVMFDLLTSPVATELLDSMIWWDEKRPITVEILKRLDLRKLSVETGMLHDFDRHSLEKGPLFASA
jgi:hypothetical protein